MVQLKEWNLFKLKLKILQSFQYKDSKKKCLPFIGRPHKVTFPDFNFDMLD